MVQRSDADRGQPRDGASGRSPFHERPPSSPWVTGIFCALTLTWVFAFGPDPLAIVTVPALIGWLAVVERSRSAREALLWMALFGAVATVVGYNWLAQTVQDFGHVPMVLSWFLTALFGIWNTIHGVVFILLYRSMLSRGRRPHPIATAALLAACETLPIRMFAWSAGHGAVDVPPLLQAAEWGGVAAVSFVLLCLVIPIYEWTRWAFVRGGVEARPKAALVTFGVGVVFFLFGMLRCDQVRTEEEEADRHLRVAIVQPTFGTEDKRIATRAGGSKRSESIARYKRGTERAVQRGAELIVWPETAITDAIPLDDGGQTNHFLAGRDYEFLTTHAEEHAFLVGLYEPIPQRRRITTNDELPRRYNTAALRPPGDMTTEWSAYRKVHLIPFGEATPFGLFDDNLPQTTFRMKAGELPQPFLEYHGMSFAPFLCYEGILAEYVREYVDGKHPDVLVSLTNDSWFGDTWEPHQHLNFTRFRAVEHRAPLIRATNTGISAFVSATGEVEARLGYGVEDVLIRAVPIVARDPTIYVRFGHNFPVLLWIIAIGAWLLALSLPPPVIRG